MLSLFKYNQTANKLPRVNRVFPPNILAKFQPTETQNKLSLTTVTVHIYPCLFESWASQSSNSFDSVHHFYRRLYIQLPTDQELWENCHSRCYLGLWRTCQSLQLLVVPALGAVMTVRQKYSSEENHWRHRSLEGGLRSINDGQKNYWLAGGGLNEINSVS